ncbi:uncharacterized protein A4U43_C05F26010 [Asparagus officinalis]|uniref:Kinesin-like protein n=1 Tax=Asparagus officinalis TaxID=4686 RepID=A0A5P1EYW1_ASPOF|nr:kinesin-like protein KIN-8A isoform X2 [Asparagus officinalis]ONK69719.1 uncharacterized protein A4U43_C05F26010 [Asparagus officinalis]
MPVSTRSQISCAPTDSSKEPQAPAILRNPHHGLKEKMKALTLLYEQHKKLASAKTHPNPNPSILQPETRITALLDSNRKNKEGRLQEEPQREGLLMRENLASKPALKKPITYSRAEEKENQEINVSDRIEVYSCPKKPTLPARKLSMGGLGPMSEGMVVKTKKMVVGPVSENRENGSRIMVFVRLRPMSRKEKEAGARSCVKIVDHKEVYLTGFALETDYLRFKRIQGRHFCFDTSFPEPTAQQEVYTTTTADLVEGVLQGRNGTVFCYGATGAGKTYTMLGTVENPGVMVLAIKDLFFKIRQRSCDGNHSVHLSYLEVYNETVRDLLAPGRPLVLREDKQGTVAAGLTQYRAYSTDEVMALLQQGNMNRTTEPTRVNETSSRSHAILQVVAEYRVKDSGNLLTRVGKLSLIDLAGSERALATDQRTQRSIEGANINRSLLALSSCINALVEGKKHIPYRNSKLTQLLKDSLGGPCNTVMIANISPSSLSFSETQNTLHWADRAKEIKTKTSTMNEEVTLMPESETDQTKLVLELQKENSELRQQLVRHQQKLLTLQAQSLASNSSPSPSPLLSPLSAPRRTKRSLLTTNCFGTPPPSEAKNSDTIKALEAEIERLKKDHALELKQKDDLIRELKLGKESWRVVTRATTSKGERNIGGGEIKSPSHRFKSPVLGTKKRTFWDIGGGVGGSPLVVGAGNGRKTRSHVAPETPPAPSMLLQPGFACRRTDSCRR